MSRNLERSVAELERKAENKVIVIKQVLSEYNEFVRGRATTDPAIRSRKERQIERVIAEYAQLHKALKRLRKKMRVAR